MSDSACERRAIILRQEGGRVEHLWGYNDAVIVQPRGARPRGAVVFMHPSVNFLHHYALEPLAERGFAAVGANSRYPGNDSTLIMENVVLDLGAVVARLRAEGYERIALCGNSGGGSLACFYQSQAEQPSVTNPPALRHPDLTKANLPPVDGLIVLNAHPGRAQVYTDWLDPSVTDETDPFSVDPSLDMYNEQNGPPYSAEFQARYRQEQVERNRRITAWAQEQLERLKVENRPARDLAFFVHRTNADLRFLDLHIDPSDREVGSLQGEPKAANYAAPGLGRYCTLRSWLSQWGLDTTNGDGLVQIKRTTVPVQVIQGTADQGCFNSYAQAFYDAAPRERELVWIKGGSHYFHEQPRELNEAMDAMADWLRRHDF